jgi:hypothetical protein
VQLRSNWLRVAATQRWLTGICIGLGNIAAPATSVAAQKVDTKGTILDFKARPLWVAMTSACMHLMAAHPAQPPALLLETSITAILTPRLVSLLALTTV